MLREFREFLQQGNVLDLAVAVILGGAFGAIVSSLVDDIIMPVIGAILGGIDFAGQVIAVNDAMIGWGNFVQAIINFLCIALVLFWLIRTAKSMDMVEEEEAAPTAEETLLTEIRDLLKEGR